MKIAKLIIRFGKIVFGIISFTALITAIILIISAVQYMFSKTGSATVLGSFKIHGFLDIPEMPKENLMPVLIFGAIMAFLIATASFAVRMCFGIMIKKDRIYTMENVQVTRRTGIFIIILFAVIIALTSLAAVNSMITGSHSFDEFASIAQEISLKFLYFGIFFFGISFFIQAGADEVSEGRIGK